MRLAAVVLSLFLLAQEEEDKIRKEVALANQPGPALQGPAPDRRPHRGAAAAGQLVAFVKARGHNALSKGCTDILGGINDPSIAALRAELVDDKALYWRGAGA